MIEEAMRPKNGRGRPRNPFCETEEYKRDRKKDRHKLHPESKRRVSIRPNYVPQDCENQNYYYAFHEKGELALKRRQSMERLRHENLRNKLKINKLKTQSTEPTIFQSPNANLLQEVSCISEATGKEILVNFLTSEKKLSEEKKQAITEKALSSSPNTVVRNVFHIKQAENTVKDRLGPNERSTHKKVRNQLERDLKKDSLLLLDEEDDIHQKEKFISYFRKEIATPKVLAKLIDENTSSINLSGVDIIASQFKKLGIITTKIQFQ